MFDDYYNFRRTLVDALERDLMGPSTPDEVIGDPPITRYIAGVLFPQDSGVIDGSQDVGEEDDVDSKSNDVEGGDWDPSVSMSHVRYPSSLGMTFAVSTETTEVIVVQPEAARYEAVEHAEDSEEESASEASIGAGVPLGRRARPRQVPDWRRIQLAITPVELDVTQPTDGRTVDLEDGLRLFSRVRPVDLSGQRLGNAHPDEHAYFGSFARTRRRFLLSATAARPGTLGRPGLRASTGCRQPGHGRGRGVTQALVSRCRLDCDRSRNGRGMG